ncbi:MAG: cytochrome b/b6 domain-containing protein [Thiolinea sp.]
MPKPCFRDGHPWHLGRNPLGGWVVVLLLLTVLAQALTGLFATDDILVEGPLYSLVSSDTAETLTGIHHLLFNVLMLLVVLHVAAIAWYRIAKQTNLIPRHGTR